jgi:uncharacterized repeat protein (TIGR03803 family)
VILRARIRTFSKPCLLLLGWCFFLVADAAASNETVIYSFAGAGNGSYPNTALVSDAEGDLYGGTGQGGEEGFGTIFELVRGRTNWTYKVLYSFTGNADGDFPSVALAIDSHGNLYGVSSTGGDYYKGNVFELSPGAGGNWTLAVLYSFTDGSDGGYPEGGVILDESGNLYGTTYYGGVVSDCSGAGCGVVFELSPGSNGSWTETVLHAFTETEGALPNSGLVFGARGILYGAASAGGTSTRCEGSPANGCGTVFEIAPSEDGWTETTLVSFDVTDGYMPQGVTYHGGKLYGTTLLGGSQLGGTVFELTLKKSGAIQTIIHDFGSGTDVTQPASAVVFGKGGNLYGSASRGGNSGCNNQGCGGIFELSPSGGNWTESIPYQFTGGDDGAWPLNTPLPGRRGSLFGTASLGGASGYGVVFELPQSN